MPHITATMKTFIFICVSVVYAADVTSAETATIVTEIGGQSVGDLCLYAHNIARSLHQLTPPVKYDDTIAAGAQDWAKKIAQLHKLTHGTKEDRKGYGQNLYYIARSDPGVQQPAAAVFAWYKESQKPGYDYIDLTNNKGVGHFTQVVWKETKKIGCGVATIEGSGLFSTYIVARYAPGGNMVGAYQANVQPLKAGVTVPENYLAFMLNQTNSEPE